MDKVQFLLGLLVLVQILSLALQTTCQQPTWQSMLLRLENEYSEATLMAQAIVPKDHINCIAARNLAVINK